MDMGIVNAGSLPVYDDIDGTLLEICEDVLWNRSTDGTERLLAYAEAATAKGGNAKDSKEANAWRELSVEDRLKHSLVKGIDKFVTGTFTFQGLKEFSKAISQFPNL